MTAEEMFRDLDYILSVYTNYAVRYYKYDDENEIYEYINFHLRSKTYRTMARYKQSSINDAGVIKITPNLHKAITKKMEELGWL